MLKKWKTINITDVSPSSWFPIERHEVDLQNGLILDDYYITTLTDVAMVVPFHKNGNMILVKQYKHGQRDFLLELPAGFLQHGKTPAESAIAELEEETGVKVVEKDLIDLGVICHIPTKSTQVVYGYLAKDLEYNSVQKFDLAEDIEVVEVSPNQVIKDIRNGHIWVSDSVSFIMKSYLLYPELFREGKVKTSTSTDF